jgi:hypothetical protein
MKVFNRSKFGIFLIGVTFVTLLISAEILFIVLASGKLLMGAEILLIGVTIGILLIAAGTFGMLLLIGEISTLMLEKPIFFVLDQGQEQQKKRKRKTSIGYLGIIGTPLV